MCEKDTPLLQIASMIKSKPKRTRNPRNPSRRTRAKRKKTKYLSLRANLSPGTTQHSGEMTPPESTSSAHMHQQLDLFPLHPERSIEEKETENENVSCLFEAAEDGGATELNSLLGSGSSSEGNVAVSASVETPNYGLLGEEEVKLERTAMRRKGRDGGEEKWVCYSEVVEERKEEEVTSCDAGVGCKVRTRHGLSLKLDYEEIMSAWSDKGPLYVQMDGSDSPQTVPDLRDHDQFYDNISNGLQDCWGNSSNNGSSLWTVPETNPSFKVKEEVVTYHEGVGGGGGIVGGEDQWNKMCHREASVLRYKEKRQNRLFSKRIRYEVRKINAEKRPRMKGRFVKRS